MTDNAVSSSLRTENRWSIYKTLVTCVLAAQLFLGALYILKVPLWMPSDERAHMRYALDLAHTGKLHVMSVGDVSYETHQPPLFYALAAVLINSSNGLSLTQQGFLLRGFCLSLQVVSSLLLAAMLEPFLACWLAVSALCCFALNPSMLAIAASISNDSLAFLLTTIWAFLLCKYEFTLTTVRQAVLVGIALGLSMLCKLTCVSSLAVTLVMLLWSSDSPGKKLKIGASLLLPVIILVAPWFALNYWTYGSATAASRLYGPTSAYLQHQQPIHSLADINWKGAFAYHFLPGEFWLNQVKTPVALQITLGLVAASALLGLLIACWEAGKQPSRFQRFFLFNLITWAVTMIAWLATAIAFSQGPIRWAFTSFFAFATLLAIGLTRTLTLVKLTPRASAILVAFAWLALNAQIIIDWLPRLSSFGLSP